MSDSMSESFTQDGNESQGNCLMAKGSCDNQGQSHTSSGGLFGLIFKIRRMGNEDFSDHISTKQQHLCQVLSQAEGKDYFHDFFKQQ